MLWDTLLETAVTFLILLNIFPFLELCLVATWQGALY